MIFNNKIKGQGALEYLLLIGGAVLIAVIVIALLVGMGSENATTARERNTAALEAIDTPIPSTISTVSCLNNGDALINWNPVFKENYQYQLTVDGVVCDDCNFDVFKSSENPKLVINGCYNLPAAFIITTKNGEKTAASNSFVKEDQALSFRVNAPKSIYPDGYAFAGENNIVTLKYDEGTEVIYTLDGTDPLDDPDPTHLDANGHIDITFDPAQYSITLKARALDQGGNLAESSLLSRTYYRIAKPEASLVSGSTVTSGTSVTLSDSVTDNPKQIYYTTDGGTPIYANPNTNLYTGPIILNDLGTITIRASTRKSEVMGLSNAFTYTVSAQPVVATPTANLSSGTYTSAQSVTLTTTTSGAKIRYTINETDPNCTSSTVYSGPITISSTTTLKAIGCKTGETPSEILTASYVINTLVVATPTINPTQMITDNVTQYTLSSGTPGATIRYAIDSAVNSSSTVYTSPFTLNFGNHSISALAIKSGMADSDIFNAMFTVYPADVSAHPESQNFKNDLTVRLSSPSEDGKEVSIRYTTDGTPPTEKNGIVYTTPIVLTSTTTITARTFVEGIAKPYNQSYNVLSETYTKTTGGLSPPVAEPEGGSGLKFPLEVTLIAADPSFKIYYTMGPLKEPPADPTFEDSVYSKPILLKSSSIIKAIVCVDEKCSGVMSETYLK